MSKKYPPNQNGRCFVRICFWHCFQGNHGTPLLGSICRFETTTQSGLFMTSVSRRVLLLCGNSFTIWYFIVVRFPSFLHQELCFGRELLHPHQLGRDGMEACEWILHRRGVWPRRDVRKSEKEVGSGDARIHWMIHFGNLGNQKERFKGKARSSWVTVATLQ